MQLVNGITMALQLQQGAALTFERGNDDVSEQAKSQLSVIS